MVGQFTVAAYWPRQKPDGRYDPGSKQDARRFSDTCANAYGAVYNCVDTERDTKLYADSPGKEKEKKGKNGKMGKSQKKLGEPNA